MPLVLARLRSRGLPPVLGQIAVSALSCRGRARGEAEAEEGWGPGCEGHKKPRLQERG
jgi:hypothetical protein